MTSNIHFEVSLVEIKLIANCESAFSYMQNCTCAPKYQHHKDNVPYIDWYTGTVTNNNRTQLFKASLA